MKHTYRQIITHHSNRHMSWLLLSLLLLCLTACSSSDDVPISDIPGDELENKTPTQLYIYVHAPQTAVPTRAYTGDVDPIGNEAMVYSLQIWAFTHVSNKLIGYFSPSETSALNRPSGYEVFQLTVDEEYAVAAVPENMGLPMSGVLRNQPVTGSAPVLRLDDGGQMAQVSLIRTVSKLRFAFANQTDSKALIINSIKLNTNMIPEEQYLFMADGAPYDRRTCHIKTASGYNTTTPELLAATINDVPYIEQPVIYAWGHEELEPQAYEHMLDVAAAEGNLAQRLYYLRESDKQLQGEIKYQIGDGEEQTATFKMVDEGGFSRNHIWTVYAYQAQARLHVVVVDIAPWKTTETNYDFYNW